MVIFTATKARDELFRLIARVNDDHDIVRITSKAGNAVLISEKDFEEMETFGHLFGSRANARRLLDAWDRIDAGDVIEVEPSVLDEMIDAAERNDASAKTRDVISKVTV